MRVISIVGYHKTGKTTLVERLVSELGKYGRVGTVKHTREEILPLAGDTERHLSAGAEVTVGVTQTRLIKIMKNTDLETVLGQLLDEGLDFAVVEGFKESGLPKIGIGDVEARNVIARVDINAPGRELAEIAMNQPEYVTMKYLIARIKRSPRIEEAGAIGTFTGIVREVHGGKCAGAPEIDSSDEAVNERIKAIEEYLKKRSGILDVYIFHKAGCIGACGGIVYIVILSRHREELFPALNYAIEYLRAEMPPGKKEFAGKGDFWMHDLD